MSSRAAGLLAGLGVLLGPTLASDPARADEPPAKWEQLFYPFPIVGAPPQLEQQVQAFADYATGSQGRSFTPSAELAYIATARLGVVADVPYQWNCGGRPGGVGDTTLLLQYLAAGSLERDDMLSVGLQGQFPTGRPGVTAADYSVGPFAYAAKRWFHRLILEGNVTMLEPVVHGDSPKQVLLDGLVSYLTTRMDSSFPVYVQGEIDSTRYFSGVRNLPGMATSAPLQTVSVAPELFLGPFKTPVNDGTRVALGVFFNLAGDPAEHRVYSLTFSFDIPNRFGY